MLSVLEPLATEFFDCAVQLSATRLDAQQLREFADAQMPGTGVGEVPWSTPLSSDQLAALAEDGHAEFINARMMLAADAEAPLIGTGVLIRCPKIYPNPRMIIVVDTESRGQGIGSRIAKELLRLVHIGETVEAEVQQEPTAPRRTANFFEQLGFSCIEERHRTGNVSEYIEGVLRGTVKRHFSLYALTKSTDD